MLMVSCCCFFNYIGPLIPLHTNIKKETDAIIFCCYSPLFRAGCERGSHVFWIGGHSEESDTSAQLCPMPSVPGFVLLQSENKCTYYCTDSGHLTRLINEKRRRLLWKVHDLRSWNSSGCDPRNGNAHQEEGFHSNPLILLEGEPQKRSRKWQEEWEEDVKLM